MKQLITTLILLTSLGLSAQMQLTPVNDYCLDATMEVMGKEYVPLRDGSGYVVVGKSGIGITYGKQHYGSQTGSLWNDDAFIAIVDNDFNVLKSNIFGGSLANDDDDYFTKVFPQPDGGFVCYGHCTTTDGDIQSPAPYSMLLFKVDSNLNKVWSKPYGNAFSAMYIIDCTQSRDGGFIMLCSSSGLSGDNMVDLDGTPFRNDWTVVKTDSAGNKLWAKVYGSTENEIEAGAIIEDVAKNIYILGSSQESDNDCISANASWRMSILTQHDIFVLKLDSAGTRLWTRSYGGSGGSAYETPFCGLYDSVNNELLIGGQSEAKDFLFSNAQYADAEAFFLRLDTAGAVQQVRTIGGDKGDQLRHIGLGPQPNTYFIGINTQSSNTGDMIGYTMGGGFQSDFFLCTIDQQNNFVMKYGMPIALGSGFGSTFYNPVKSEVILNCAFGPHAQLFCDSVMHTTNIKKPAIRRLRFDPLGLRQAQSDRYSLTLYPNPAQDKLYIKEEVPANSIVFIADMSGRLLKRNNYSPGQAIDLSGLSAGHYLITIKNNAYVSTIPFSIFP